MFRTAFAALALISLPSVALAQYNNVATPGPQSSGMMKSGMSKMSPKPMSSMNAKSTKKTIMKKSMSSPAPKSTR